MEPSIQSILKERKYPFLFAFFVLLLCFTVLFLTNNHYTHLPVIDTQNSHAISSPPSNASNPFPLLPSSPNRKEKTRDGVTPDQTSSGGAELNLMTWELCKGYVAVDYIPCLDNMKAIKQLKTKKHMEHRERHCPTPSPRCLIPLPQNYKMPIPWPKSRDMAKKEEVQRHNVTSIYRGSRGRALVDSIASF